MICDRCHMLSIPAILASLIVAGPADPPPEPVQPLAEYARRLKDPDREKRLVAAEAIRDHYKGKSIDVLPQMMEVLGEDLDRPRQPNQGRTYLLDQTLCQMASGTGDGWLKVVQMGTCHASPRIRAAAFRMWWYGLHDQAADVERDELLAAVRKGLKDDSPLVRGQAAVALRAFWNAPPRVVETVIPLLIATLNDRVQPRKGVSSPAAHAVAVLPGFKAQAKSAISALGRAADSQTDEAHLIGGACTALRLIAQSDPAAAEDVVAILRPLIGNKQRSGIVRGNAIAGLVGIGPAARKAIPELTGVLEDPIIPPERRYTVYTILTELGPRAEPAVPTLIRRLIHSADETEHMCICVIFRTMGPAAGLAERPLEQWMNNIDKPILKRYANDALAAIRK